MTPCFQDEIDALLHSIENEIGPRDPDIEILPLKFEDIDTPFATTLPEDENKVQITLTNLCLEDQIQRQYQLAHELVHALGWVGGR